MRAVFPLSDILARQFSDVSARAILLSLYIYHSEPLYEYERTSINNIRHNIYDGPHLRADFPDEIRKE